MEHLAKELYAYCTDFIINLANLLNLSYYEVNAILFCFLYPFLMIVSIVFFLIQKRKFRRINRE